VTARRPRSAKVRNRGKWGTDRAAVRSRWPRYEGRGPPVGMSWMWTSPSSTRLLADARGRDGGVREELAAGVRACRLLGTPEMRPISEPIQRILNDQPEAVFGSVHRTCLSALVTDPAMEAWYHSLLHE
jgi:hypothetical protein